MLFIVTHFSIIHFIFKKNQENLDIHIKISDLTVILTDWTELEYSYNMEDEKDKWHTIYMLITFIGTFIYTIMIIIQFTIIVKQIQNIIIEKLSRFVK